MKKGTTEDGVVYHAGFPNAGEDQRFDALSLDQIAIKHRASTYLWRLDAEGVPELGWTGGSIVVVNKALSPKPNDLVVAVVDEDFAVRRFQTNRLTRLDGSAETSEQLAIWGVITHVLMEYRSV
jgi:DNA polymerase V